MRRQAEANNGVRGSTLARSRSQGSVSNGSNSMRSSRFDVTGRGARNDSRERAWGL